jgi:uncharacterized phage protein gp47/JayE
MPFSRPLLTDLQSQALADVAALGTGDLLRRSISLVLPYAQAGLAHGHYGFLDYISLQAVPATATGEFMYQWGYLKGITPKAATPASGAVTFTGAAGVSIPSGTQVSAAGGVTYSTTASGTVSGTTVTVLVTADIAGSAGNLGAGSAISLSTSISGINAAGIVATAITSGADVETDSAYRLRMLARYASPPQGGSSADYIGWATEVAGVTRAWVAPNGAGAGTVVVYTMWDDVEAAHGGFPQGSDGVATGETRDTAATGDQLVVANYIFAPFRRPTTALVFSVAPSAYPINFTIADLDTSTADVRAAISVALTAVFRRSASPGGTTYPLAVSGAVNGKMYPSEFQAAIAAVSGVNRFTLTAPAISIIAPAGSIPALGTITYV